MCAWPTCSRSPLYSMSCSNSPGCVACLIAFAFSFALRMIVPHPFSTSLNVRASSGSCFWMSGELKIGSRDIQLRWHVVHSSST